MFSKKSAEKASRYVDPTGEFPNRELVAAAWYLRHKLFFGRALAGVLAVVAAGTLGFSLLEWGKYAVVGYEEDRKLAERQVAVSPDYAALQPLTAAQPLTVSGVDVFQSAKDTYDFAAMVRNPNTRWAAYIRYRFTAAQGATSSTETMLLPQTERPVAVFGEKRTQYPVNARFEIEDIKWKKIDSHAVPDVADYLSSRLWFTADQFSFTPANPVSGVPAHQIQFTLTNESAYSYWEPAWYVELLGNGQPVGIVYLSLGPFRSGEERVIELRSFAPALSATDIRLTPVIDIFDPEVYIEPGT